MNRIIDYFLQEWKHKDDRKSLLLRGLRQVGKTHAIRTLGATYENFVEINFEAHHSNCPYGLRFSHNNYSDYQLIRSYPLYAIAQVMTQYDEQMKKAILH
jgi:predicted AAA+ superfamily ATPase